MKRQRTKEQKRQKRYLMLPITILTVLSLSACTNFSAGNHNPDISQLGVENTERIDTGFELTGPGSYDSADTTILIEKNSDDSTITFLNLDLGKQYTLSIDGTTYLYDKYGESISLEQIPKGSIVDIKFLKSKKHLTSMQLSAQSWSYENVERYEIDTVRGEVTIGEETYKISENTQYLSAGRNIDSMELNASDVLNFYGLDKEILCVTVEKGHGYLRLVNDENFVGGWIEIGQSQIQQITQDMLLTVPEGSYEVGISHKGGGGTKSVVINRNEETSLDIGDLTVAEVQYGTILFSLSPSSASLYIDGTKQDTSQPVSLEYGIHQLIVKANGYQTITRYLRVGEESAAIDISLDALEGSEQEGSVSGSDGNKTNNTDTITGYYKVYVDAPEQAEVYLDGNYVGISPCSFRKNSGAHVITLRKSGYVTRSYTVQVDSEDKDISYSFADLVKSSN